MFCLISRCSFLRQPVIGVYRGLSSVNSRIKKVSENQIREFLPFTEQETKKIAMSRINRKGELLSEWSMGPDENDPRLHLWEKRIEQLVKDHFKHCRP